MSKAVDAVKSTVAENLGGIAHSVADKEHQFSIEEVPDLSGKVAIVTGGSEGIGYGVTHTFLSRNIQHLYILSLSQEVVDGAIEAMRQEIGDEAAKKVTWIHCDLANWRQVKQVADQISKSTSRIDILVNNAARGIMTFQLSEDGIDRHMALNHFGHVILTSHLLPIIKKTASESRSNTIRIVNQASNAHQTAPEDTRFAEFSELTRDVGPMAQYGRSKLANILYSRYLNRHLTSAHKNILVNATHPGMVETEMSVRDIHEPYPLGGYGMSVAMKPLKKDNFMGAVSALFAATKTTKSGEYICPPAVPEPGSALAQDVELAERLMKLTREVIQEKTYDESVAKGCPFKDY